MDQSKEVVDVDEMKGGRAVVQSGSMVLVLKKMMEPNELHYGLAVTAEQLAEERIE
jgi:hypothetical protein